MSSGFPGAASTGYSPTPGSAPGVRPKSSRATAPHYQQYGSYNQHGTTASAPSWGSVGSVGYGYGGQVRNPTPQQAHSGYGYGMAVSSATTTPGYYSRQAAPPLAPPRAQQPMPPRQSQHSQQAYQPYQPTQQSYSRAALWGAPAVVPTAPATSRKRPRVPPVGGVGSYQGMKRTPQSNPTAFAASSASSSTASPALGSGSAGWPPSLLRYVQRAFACKPEEKSAVESLLSSRIKRAKSLGLVHTTNWDLEPLPRPGSQQQQQQQQVRKSQQLVFNLSLKKSRGGGGARGGRAGGFSWGAPANSSVGNVFGAGANSGTTYGAFAKNGGNALGATTYGAAIANSSAEPSTAGFGFLTKKPNGKKKSRKRRRGKGTAKGQQSEIDALISEFDTKKRGKRADRFRKQQTGGVMRQMSTMMQTPKQSLILNPETGELEVDFEALKIRGTCEELEKDYYRLTTLPDPSTVRPVRVLRKTLAMLEQRWDQERDYQYTSQQFKSMRQDLYVQHQHGEFAVLVHETNARIAIEMGDLSEFNQCQTQLFIMYETGGDAIRANYYEFICYQILYFLITDDAGDLLKLLSSLSKRERRDETAVAFAINVMRAVVNENFVAFFRLRSSAPNRSSSFMDKLVPRIRFQALRTAVKGFRPQRVDLAVFARMLGFGADVSACSGYVTACGAKIAGAGASGAGGAVVLTRESSGLHRPVNNEAEYADDKRKGITHGSFT